LPTRIFVARLITYRKEFVLDEKLISIFATETSARKATRALGPKPNDAVHVVIPFVTLGNFREIVVVIQQF
jgi:hypothetical protein